MQEYVKHLLDGCYLLFVEYLQEKKKHIFMSWNRPENGGPKFRPRKSVQGGKFVKNSVGNILNE